MDLRYRIKKISIRVLSTIWLLTQYYVGLYIHATMAWFYCIKGPFLKMFGISWWTFMDYYYELYERIMILQGIELLRIKLTFHGDFPYVRGRRENCLIICNHQSEFDAYIMAAALEKTGNLAEQRHVLKNSVKWLPFIGYFLLDRGSIFVDRTRVDWDAFDTVCRRLRRNNVPVCITIYPEDTIMNWALENREIREKSRQMARDHGREPFQHVLFPKYRGFFRLLSLFRDRLDAVYDFTFIHASTRGPDGHRKPAPGLFAATLLTVLKKSPQVASFKTEYAGEDSDCGEDQLCWWEVKIAEPSKTSEFMSSLGQEGVGAPLVLNDDPPVMSEIANDEADDQSDAGAYAVLAQAWSKLIDDIQEGVDQIKAKKFSKWSCFLTTSVLLSAAPWVFAIGSLIFAKQKSTRGGGVRLKGETLSGGGVYGAVLTDVEVDDATESRQASWTTPPMHREVQGDHRYKSRTPSPNPPSLHHGVEPNNLLSRTDVEYYDVEGMLNDVPYYEPHLPEQRH
ncbi:uncharacterized protein LOC111249871 isoform X2 [Varroa destructor]|uniref:Phospholipid/glycerol acyltransferase domain-containing protein n=1 Tax=Varroa destructor TaxID=109461 RepID=A0A7M7KEX1_VARDE|nr:uncharacterized protein LOC111249871 isoform X2 [Varroa destructor]